MLRLPDSLQALAVQQRAAGEAGQGLGEEEDGHGTPVTGAQPLDQLQQHGAWRRGRQGGDGTWLEGAGRHCDISPGKDMCVLPKHNLRSIWLFD